MIHHLKDRFPYQITGMNHCIENSREHSSLFLPVYLVEKIEDQGGNGGTVSHRHEYDTRFRQQNRSYYPQDSHGMSTTTDEESQKEAFKKYEQKKEEARKEKETIESNERRYQMQQIKKQLQIGEIAGFDDTMLDRERQEKILEDLKRQNKEKRQLQIGEMEGFDDTMLDRERQEKILEDLKRQNKEKRQLQIGEMEGFDDTMLDRERQEKILEDLKRQNKENQQNSSQAGKTNATYTAPTVPQSRSTVSDYQYDQQLHNKQLITHQDPHAQVMHPQDVHSQGMLQPHVGQQGIYTQGTHSQLQQAMYLPPQGRPPQYVPRQGIPHHGIPQQGIHSQEMPQQNMYPQYQHPQGMTHSSVAQQDPYQQSIPQRHQFTQSPNNSNWYGSYPMERQQSIEFHQILRADTNTPNSCDTSYRIISTRQHQNISQDMHRPSEPYREMEAPYNIPPLEVGDAIQSGNNPICYGTIKWIGIFPGSKELFAGVEMVLNFVVI